MKKILLLFVSLLLTVCFLDAQTVILEENFDSFTPGNKLVQTINDQTRWDTWSSAPGGSEDAVISDKYSSSPANSLYLANNNDIVLMFNDLTEGRYQVRYKLFIESGKIGYFNMLHDFAAGNSQWAFQVYFNTNGVGKVDAAKANAATFSYTYDTWLDVNVIIDLDDDFATFYLDDKEVVSWKWSLGTSGGGSLKKLDAINFYGITQGGSSGMYVDDVLISQVTSPEAPSNLNAQIQNEGEVFLSWDAPNNPPDNYVLIRNAEVVSTDITDTEYLDVPYPGIGNYTVKAHTSGLGYSMSSNEVTVDLPGGVDREWVLFEIGTGTGCVYCPGAAMGAKDMENNGDNVAIIKYHNFNANDPFNSEASSIRAGSYYGITGYPTSFADGTLSLAGGSPTSSLFETYHNHYLSRKSKKAIFSMEAHVWHVKDNEYRAIITVEQHSGYNTEQKTLHTALTESDIDYTWFNQDQVHYACRNMFPDAYGTALNFDEENVQTLEIDFTMEESWVKENCELVVFLQADPSKEVMVAAKVDMADVLLNNEETAMTRAHIAYPNPCTDMIYFKEWINAPFRMKDISGRTVLEGFAENRIDVSVLNQGMYLLELEGFPTQKIIIR